MNKTHNSPRNINPPFSHLQSYCSLMNFYIVQIKMTTLTSAPQQLSSDPQNSEAAPPSLDGANEPINTANPILIDTFTDDSEDLFEDESSDMTSLSSSVLDYEYENGRRYHSSRTGNYMYITGMPNDEEEQDRMDLAHHMFELSSKLKSRYTDMPSRFVLLLKGDLFKAPVKNPQKVLDLGTGTGIWAIEFAERYPQAQVIGNDISPIQPSWVCPNLEFVVEDYEQDWIYKPNSFDFIHARLLSGCVVNWPRLLSQILDALQPGAYFEIQESAIWAWSDDGSLKADSPLIQYLEAINIGARMQGKKFNIYHKLRQWLIDAGFEDVQQSTYFLPYSPWPKDPALKELGRYQAAMAQQAVEAYGLRLFTQVMGWGEEPSKVLIALAKRQLRDKSMHAYCKEVFVYGRKPL
ncbi:hypothetical protein PENSTE_c009G03540 [Penicillium steckii]|uniref:Methyltransferase domain-containing protein n=1 Tax=Penicillium steckii TaxID=303698 RepID=A0A1V6TCG4_9EURO|nr:hypothetical protein PENSTE_c009G03540 [Penicillium steckii]